MNKVLVALVIFLYTIVEDTLKIVESIS